MEKPNDDLMYDDEQILISLMVKSHYYLVLVGILLDNTIIRESLMQTWMMSNLPNI
jgi:hypothetical protein